MEKSSTQKKIKEIKAAIKGMLLKTDTMADLYHTRHVTRRLSFDKDEKKFKGFTVKVRKIEIFKLRDAKVLGDPAIKVQFELLNPNGELQDLFSYSMPFVYTLSSPMTLAEALTRGDRMGYWEPIGNHFRKALGLSMAYQTGNICNFDVRSNGLTTIPLVDVKERKFLNYILGPKIYIESVAPFADDFNKKLTESNPKYAKECKDIHSLVLQRNLAVWDLIGTFGILDKVKSSRWVKEYNKFYKKEGTRIPDMIRRYIRTLNTTDGAAFNPGDDKLIERFLLRNEARNLFCIGMGMATWSYYTFPRRSTDRDFEKWGGKHPCYDHREYPQR